MSTEVAAVEPGFGFQPTPTTDLPNPEKLVTQLMLCVMEIYVGVRDVEQLSRWVTDSVYLKIQRRAAIAARSRAATGHRTRPTFRLVAVRLTYPCDGVVEATGVVRGRQRCRALAIRLEGLDRRWRATSLSVC